MWQKWASPALNSLCAVLSPPPPPGGWQPSADSPAASPGDTETRWLSRAVFPGQSLQAASLCPEATDRDLVGLGDRGGLLHGGGLTFWHLQACPGVESQASGSDESWLKFHWPWIPGKACPLYKMGQSPLAKLL